jgi:plasmid maintenance system antidote protein VapI
MAISITRVNPRTGQTERPWRNRDGLFVLGDPAHGAQRHHDKFAVKVGTIEEVATLVAQGFSVRMSDGRNPASLIAADSLSVEQIKGGDPGKLFAETTPKPPFKKKDMMDELKQIMLVQANQIAHAGGLDFATSFIGFEASDSFYPFCREDIAKVDLTRFRAAHYLDRAYDYAFQVEKYWDWQDGLAQDIREFVLGANPQSSDGEASPLCNLSGLCRLTADTAFARWRLNEGSDLSIRELALLAQMTEAAVRNALSKERITIDNGEVDGTVAESWLHKRRDFIATRSDEGRKKRWAVYCRDALSSGDFATAFAEIMRGFALTAEELAAKAAVPSEIISSLITGKPATDLDALCRVANALEIDAPHFTGMAVQAALAALESA